MIHARSGHLQPANKKHAEVFFNLILGVGI